MKSILTGLLVLSCAVGVSQSPKKDSTQSCIANWKKGETKIYTVTNTKEKFDNGKPISKSVFNYDAAIQVTDSTYDGYSMEWSYKGTSSKKNDEMANIALAIFKGLKIKYKTNSTGEFKELVNWEEVRDFYIGMMQKSLPKNVDDSTKMLLQKTYDMFSTKEAVEGTLIKDVQLLHSAHGYEYSTKGTTNKTTIPSPFGTDPIPSLVTIRITEIRPSQNYFRLTVNQQIDKEGALKMIRDFIKKMGVASDKDVEEGLKVFKNFEVTNNSDYSITISSGWISRLFSSKTVVTGSSRQVESYLFEEKK